MTEKEKERFEVLLEHMDRKIDVVLEGHSHLDRKMEAGFKEAREERQAIRNELAAVAKGLSRQINENREAIEKNSDKIDNHDRKFDRAIARIENHEIRIRKLEMV
jgi:hypothetical protein